MKLKKWVKVTLTIIAIIIAVIIFIASEKEDRKMIKNCINKGYTVTECKGSVR